MSDPSGPVKNVIKRGQQCWFVLRLPGVLVTLAMLARWLFSG